MRSDPRDYELAVPGSLHAVLSLMAAEPGAWTPIAGGTDLMVLFSAGKLAARKLVSISKLSDLNQIQLMPDEIRIGACCTFSDLRGHPAVAREFPLLAAAAALTGGIANQNRATLGGNIVNASPAADSLPALLVYGAVLRLVSVHGEREVPYTEFHRGYKQHLLRPDELLHSIRVPRRYASYVSFTQKVGARQAQAIAKVSIAAVGSIAAGSIDDIRIALGSVAPVPLRLAQTERLLIGKQVDPALVDVARRSVARQINPVDDIRSNVAYRASVAANLVAEFVETLCSSPSHE